ncbi:hypothetical protein X793_06735 [Dehalococcoides mccartyi CG4]|nr:hypothetical protein X793_06735 [Dehalococcoides mccartyi CG4]
MAVRPDLGFKGVFPGKVKDTICVREPWPYLPVW